MDNKDIAPKPPARQNLLQKGTTAVYDFMAARSIARVILLAVAGFLGTLFLVVGGTRFGAPPTLSAMVLEHKGDSVGRSLVLEPVDAIAQLPPGTAPVRLLRGQFFYHQYPTLLIWTLLFAFMTGYALACLPLFAAYHQWIERKLIHRVPDFIAIGTNGHKVAAVVLGLTLFIVPLAIPGILSISDFLHTFHMPFASRWIILLPLMVVLISACFGAFAMFSIGASTDLLKIKPDSTAAELVEVEDLFARMDGMLRHCLTLMALMVAFSVITTGTLRTGLMSMYPDPEGFPMLPIEFVHAYGLFFTAFLAILYLPVQFLMNTKGQQLYKDMQAAMAHLPEPATPPQPTGKPYVSESSDGWSRFKLALAIMGPFISSFLPEALKNLFAN